MSSTASFVASAQSTHGLFPILLLSADEEEGDPTEEFIVQGELENYDLGEQSLTASNGFDPAEGTLISAGPLLLHATARWTQLGSASIFPQSNPRR